MTLIPEASFSSKAALRLCMERSPRSKRWSGWSCLSPESLSLTTWLPKPQGRQAPLGQSDSSLRERPLLWLGPSFFLLQGTLNFTHLSYLGCAWLDASQEMNFLTWMDMLEKWDTLHYQVRPVPLLPRGMAASEEDTPVLPPQGKHLSQLCM